MSTWLHHTVPADFSGALLYCESPVLLHPKGALLDLDPQAEKFAEDIWTYCHVQETFLRRFFVLWYGALEDCK